MFHNMKADIIYYKSATDFELEFNLCGCCRMRLLSDKMQDKKSFVHSLARAVSRSSVILIAGPLFGEEGSIKIVSDAINTSTEIADNSAFGILSDDQIEIIKDSVPLVTPDGYFGGCIIESGPQTMILLTDNKNIRKTIMQTLIHPYITELYASQTGENEDTNDQIIINDNAQEITEETVEDENPQETEIPTENDIIIDEQSNQADDSQIDTIDNNTEEIPTPPSITEHPKSLQESLIFDNEDENEEEYPQDDSMELFFEPTKLDRKTVERYTKEYMAHSSYDDQDYYYKNDKSKNSLALCIFIISIILLLIVVALCYFIFLVPAKSGISPVANLQEIFKTMFG